MSEESKPPSVHSSIRLRAIPGHGWTPLLAFAIALCWLAPTGIHRFIHRQRIAKSDPSMPQPAGPGIMRPQPSGIIALAYRGKRFCVRARTLALSHFGIRVSSGGGTFLTTCCRGGCSSSLGGGIVSRWYYMCRVGAVERRSAWYSTCIKMDGT